MTQALPCGCCTSSAALTPLDETNRAELSAIAYRVGTYSSFRESMLEQISRTAGITDLTTRADDDYSITMADLWAAVGEVLSFYQERYANEAFLRTAQQRESIVRLARLIDYSLRPGVAALAWLAFTVENGKTLDVPTRLRVQSVPGQNEQPQTFETLEEIQADARFNRLRVLPAPQAVNPFAQASTGALAAPSAAGVTAAGTLTPNDRLALYSVGSPGQVEMITIDHVTVDEDRVEIGWKVGIQGSWPASTPVSKIGRILRPFGHTAPATTMTPTADSSSPPRINWTLTATSYELASSSSLALDTKIDGIDVGTRLLVHDTAGAATVVTVTSVATGAESLGGLTDTVTVLGITPAIPAAADLRTVTAYELVGPQIAFWGYAYAERVLGGSLFLPGKLLPDGRVEVARDIARFAYQPGTPLAATDLAPGRSLLVGDAATEPVPATVTSVEEVGSTAVFGPTANDTTTVKQLGLDAASNTVLVGLISNSRPSPFTLTSQTPQLRVRIGDLPARTVLLSPTPGSLADAAAALEQGLHAAGPEPELQQARALDIADRLVVFPGGKGGTLEILPTDLDGTTVRELGLDRDQVLTTRGLLSISLTLPIAFTNAVPEVSVTIGPIGPRTIAVQSAAQIASLAALLQAAIRGADLAPAFSEALALPATDRLLLLPGPFGSEITEYIRVDGATDDPLDLDASTAYLLGNVAAASHGETVRSEVLGDGDGSARFQHFPLRKSPLTYVPSTAPGGVDSTLEVLVNGVLWNPEPGLYGLPPTAQAYVARTQDDGTTLVQFGDGRTGAPLPTGRGNVTATYRVGAGVAGRVRAGTLTTALDRPPGLKQVTNPLAARGGADPELIEYARENAPTTVRTFGRAVSLPDFSDLVCSSGEVAKAQAIWTWDGLDRAIYLTVAGQLGGFFADADLRRLGANLTNARDPNYRLHIQNYTPFPVLVSGTVQVDDSHVATPVLAAVRAAVLAWLDFDAVALGTPIHLSDLYRVIQDVPGVLFADITELQAKQPADRDRPNVDRLPDGSPAPLQPHVRIFPARPDPATPGVVLPAELATVEDPARDVVLAGQGGLDS
jgi:uncharacterized phage protein gp47/JayE